MGSVSYMKEMAKKLAVVQREIIRIRKPVLILIEGWESSGKGDVIKSIIREMDPRYYKVRNFKVETDEEKRKTFLWRYWDKLPAKGEIALFDRAYYQHLMDEDDINKPLNKSIIRDIRNMERQLYDDDMCIIKLFLKVSQGVQRNNILKLAQNKDTRFRVNSEDYIQNLRYDEFSEHFDKLIKETSFSFAPWHEIDMDNLESATKHVQKLVEKILEKFLNREKKEKLNSEKEFKGASKNVLDKVDLNKRLTKSEYSKLKKQYQKEIFRISNELYNKKIPCVLVFEGWDAAGKGGAIKRMTKEVDPRGYEVIPVSKPTKKEYDYHYLWRFYKDLPKTGHIAIFDRSWYGRLMVERIEGFATKQEWQRAYREINEFESHLSAWGAIVIKFFLHIDKDVQMERFNSRMEDPYKRHKITEEDWRNREKWDQYYESIGDMIAKTNKKNAPWAVIPANDKLYARVAVMKTFINKSKKFMKEFYEV